MAVEKTIKEIENSAVEMSIKVGKENLADSYAKVLQKYMKTLQIPGFRKGKAPASVLEQKFGSSMKEEGVFTAIDEAVQEALGDLEDKYKPLPYSQPNLVDEESISKEIDKDLEFAITYDILPVFELPPYTGLTAEISAVEVAKADVDREIEKLREQNAMIIEKEGKVEKGNIVTVDYVELDADKNPVDGTERKDFVFTVGSGTNFYKIDEDLIGMEKGEEKIIEKSFPADYEYSAYAGKSITLRLEVKEIKYRDVPALDDEFAQDVSDEYKSVGDLVSGTKKMLVESLENHLKEEKFKAIADKILEGTQIEVPKSMVDIEVNSSWNRFVGQSGMPEEQVLQFLQFQGQTKEDVTKEWREPAEKEIRLQLLIEKIKEKEDIKVDEKELEEEVEKQLEGVTDENTRNYYRSVIEGDMQTRKTYDFLLENNEFKDGEKVSYEEFFSRHQH